MERLGKMENKFKVGDKVRHYDNWENLVFEISDIGRYQDKYYYKPKFKQGETIFCKNLQKYCLVKDYSVIRDGIEYVTVQYPDGSSCEATAESFEPFVPKFKKGDYLKIPSEPLVIRQANCDSYLNEYGQEVIDVSYCLIDGPVNKKLSLKYFNFEKAEAPKPKFEPKFKKGDLLVACVSETGPPIRTASCDSYIQNGHEWVNIDYTFGPKAKCLRASIFEKYNPPKFSPALKKGDVVRFKDGDNFYILNEDSFMYNGEELVYIPCISTNVKNLVKYVPAK